MNESKNIDTFKRMFIIKKVATKNICKHRLDTLINKYNKSE